MDDGKTRRNGLDFRRQRHREEIGADGEEQVVLREGLADLRGETGDGTAEQRMGAGKGCRVVHALEMHGSADRLGELDEFRQRAALRHAVAGQDHRRSAPQQPAAAAIAAASPRRREAMRVGRPRSISASAFNMSPGIERKTGRSAGERGLGGAMEQARQIGEAAYLDRPFDERTRDLRQIGPQDWLGDGEALVVLAGGDQDWRAGLVGVVEHAHGIAQAGRYMDVHGREAARGLGVAAGHGQDRALLQGQHVAGRGLDGQRVHQRQLGRAGIAEDHLDALLAQQLEEGALAGYQRHERFFDSFVK